MYLYTHHKNRSTFLDLTCLFSFIAECSGEEGGQGGGSGGPWGSKSGAGVALRPLPVPTLYNGGCPESRGRQPKFTALELLVYNIAAVVASVAAGYDVRLSNVTAVHPSLLPATYVSINIHHMYTSRSHQSSSAVCNIQNITVIDVVVWVWLCNSSSPPQQQVWGWRCWISPLAWWVPIQHHLGLPPQHLPRSGPPRQACPRSGTQATAVHGLAPALPPGHTSGTHTASTTEKVLISQQWQWGESINNVLLSMLGGFPMHINSVWKK